VLVRVDHVARFIENVNRGILLIVENDLRGTFVDLKLGAHLLDLCIVLFQTSCDSFHLLSIG
jgi:hypothetical protein